MFEQHRWRCPCGANNMVDAERCFQCGALPETMHLEPAPAFSRAAVEPPAPVDAPPPTGSLHRGMALVALLILLVGACVYQLARRSRSAQSVTATGAHSRLTSATATAPVTTVSPPPPAAPGPDVTSVPPRRPSPRRRVPEVVRIRPRRPNASPSVTGAPVLPPPIAPSLIAPPTVPPPVAPPLTSGPFQEQPSSREMPEIRITVPHPSGLPSSGYRAPEATTGWW